MSLSKLKFQINMISYSFGRVIVQNFIHIDPTSKTVLHLLTNWHPSLWLCKKNKKNCALFNLTKSVTDHVKFDFDWSIKQPIQKGIMILLQQLHTYCIWTSSITVNLP